MEYNYNQTQFSKILFAGVYAGIIATVATLTFNFFYRMSTDYNSSMIINVSSLIFGSLIVLEFCALVYLALTSFMKNPAIIYLIIIIAIGVLCLLGTSSVVHADNLVESTHFHGLLLGVISIFGLCAIAIPYFIKHADKFF
ncbi:MAG: hypothetical protein JSS67_03875 [Bacteroidetes bacterium]|nr:hypothetical protein [Bacteroidota bacterium]